MDEKQWQAYEQKHTALKRRYRWLYLRTWLIWMGYYAATTALSFWLLLERHHNPLIYFTVANTLYSLFLTMRHIAKLRRAKHAQWVTLVESAPLGKIQV